MIGKNYKTIRTARHLTLRDVEIQTGISNAYLSQLENGKIKTPSYAVVKTLNDFYGIKEGAISVGELEGLVSVMTDEQVDYLTQFAKFILSNKQQ